MKGLIDSCSFFYKIIHDFAYIESRVKKNLLSLKYILDFRNLVLYL